MKNTKLNILLSTILLVFACVNDFAVVADETIDTTKHEEKQWSLQVASVKYPVLFEDNDGYSNDFIDAVVSDIGLLYSRFLKHTFYKFYEKREFIIKGDVIISKKRITLPIWPESFKNNELYVAEFEGKDHVVITSGLLNGYEKAMEFKDNYAEEFNKLHRFIDFLNNSDEYIVPDKLMKLYDFRFAPYMKKVLVADIKARNNKNPLKLFKIYMPSILEVYISKDDKIKGCLIYEAVCLYKKLDKVSKVFPLVYLDTEWKILMGPPPGT